MVDQIMSRAAADKLDRGSEEELVFSDREDE
jgi:hypothetical protein